MQLLGAGYHLHLVGAYMPSHLPSNVTREEQFMPPPAVAELMASSDAFLHAGDKETFGLVVLESMASGLPVIGVRAGAVAELVSAETGILAQPHSAESLAAAVRQLFQANVRQLGLHARQYVVQHYTWASVFQQLSQHYHAVLENSHGRKKSIAGV